jgi:hypothetical protein
MSRIASRNGRPASLSEGPRTPVSPAPGKAAQKANGVLLRKQSAGDTPKLSNGTGASQRLAAKLSELLSRFHVSSLIENLPQGMHLKCIQQLLQTCKRPSTLYAVLLCPLNVCWMLVRFVLLQDHSLQAPCFIKLQSMLVALSSA